MLPLRAIRAACQGQDTGVLDALFSNTGKGREQALFTAFWFCIFNNCPVSLRFVLDRFKSCSSVDILWTLMQECRGHGHGYVLRLFSALQESMRVKFDGVFDVLLDFRGPDGEALDPAFYVRESGLVGTPYMLRRLMNHVRPCGTYPDLSVTGLKMLHEAFEHNNVEVATLVVAWRGVDGQRVSLAGPYILLGVCNAMRFGKAWNPLLRAVLGYRGPVKGEGGRAVITPSCLFKLVCSGSLWGVRLLLKTDRERPTQALRQPALDAALERAVFQFNRPLTLLLLGVRGLQASRGRRCRRSGCMEVAKAFWTVRQVNFLRQTARMSTRRCMWLGVYDVHQVHRVVAVISDK